jgi:hypothetical protein
LDDGEDGVVEDWEVSLVDAAGVKTLGKVGK